MTATATETEYQTIEVSTTDHVCTVTLNRPDVYNAVNDAFTKELADALKKAERDRDVRVLVITGAGKAFCSGQDLGDLKKKYVPGYVPELGDDLRRRYNPLIRRIWEMDKPVIAAVNGVAAGAGCSLALACDIRIASQEASFIEVFINVGLVPDSASTFTLPRLVGLGRAKELCFTGQKVTADEAERIGLVNRVVAPEVLADEVNTLARKLASLPGRGIALTKHLLNQSGQNDMAGQLEAEAFAQDTAGRTDDHREGVTAFLEKRKPEFKGEVSSTVGIIGAGTMGAGIAQVAAAHGWIVELMDVDEATVQQSITGIVRRFARLAEKGRMTPDEGREASSRLRVATSPECFSGCTLIIEAIVEDLSVKTTVLEKILPAIPADAIIATNTSSLSVSRIGEAIAQPRRTVGMHFFNPAPLMRLVEVIAGTDTDPAVVDRVAEIAAAWGKTVARAADVPGFIVNHVARPYYLEAFRILEDGLARPDMIDTAMTELAHFRMGPLELTDLIGQDVNTATTRSVWEQLEHPPLLHPSRLQEQLVADGHLGRKTGRGVYDHKAVPPFPAIEFEQQYIDSSPELTAAVAAFCARAGVDGGDRLEQYIVARILAGLIVQAHLACEQGVATPEDIDTALQHGTNYPRGPFELTADVGSETVAGLLEALNADADDDRFATPRSMAVGGLQA